MTDLNALADRVEALEGFDHETNADLEEATTPGWKDQAARTAYYSGHRKSHEPRNFTGSLDAAMQLVPEGWAVTVTRFTGGRGKAIVWRGDWSENHDPGHGVDARTPAIALCAAALRARAMEVE